MKESMLACEIQSIKKEKTNSRTINSQFQIGWLPANWNSLFWVLYNKIENEWYKNYISRNAFALGPWSGRCVTIEIFLSPQTVTKLEAAEGLVMPWSFIPDVTSKGLVLLSVAKQKLPQPLLKTSPHTPHTLVEEMIPELDTSSLPLHLTKLIELCTASTEGWESSRPALR